MVTENITQDDLLDEVAAWVDSHAAAHERPGPEWFTTREIADRTGRELDQTRRWLNQGVKDGLYEKRVYGRSFAYYRKVK